MKAGIAVDTLVSQVKNTAAWLWDEPRASEITRTFDDASARAAELRSDAAAYLQLLLTAHFATVATFVPTDVDARIRHHAWQDMESSEQIATACDLVDTVAGWDTTLVSARVVISNAHGRLSGHDGEWLSVRAGALGRAAILGASDLVERLSTAIDAELDRAEAHIREALATKNTARILSVATTVAHNLGDLSRVVDEWPKSETLAALRPRYSRLGHPESNAGRPLFVATGILNKALVAHENHRFLPLRKPRALRSSRALLLPIGPWFDAWGEAIAKSPLLEDRDRADVLAALLELHGRDPAQEGCLRAIAGLHRATRGGIELFVPDLPARMRKDALRGRVRDVLDVTVEHFGARMERRYKTERDALPASVRAAMQ